MLEILKKQLANAKLEYAKESQARDILLKECSKLSHEIEKNKNAIHDILLKKELLNEASKEARANGGTLLSDMTTKILKMGFGEDVSMEMKIDERKNPTTAEIEITSVHKSGSVENDPEFDGGGLVDTVAISSFEAFNFLQRKNKAPLFFDEPTKFVSNGFSNNVAKALYEMSHNLQKQTLLITHDKTTIQMADEGFFLELDGNRETKVKNRKTYLQQLNNPKIQSDNTGVA